MGVAPAAKPAVNEDDPNLVELAVYGIAALYESYDPNKPADTAAPDPTKKPPTGPGPGPGPGGPTKPFAGPPTGPMGSPPGGPMGGPPGGPKGGPNPPPGR